MSFMRKFDTLLQKSNNNVCKIDSQDGINLYNYDNNFTLLSSKKLMNGVFSFLDYWFDINSKNHLYGLINDKNGFLNFFNITDKCIFKTKIIQYNPNLTFIKFVYIKDTDESTNIFYYSLDITKPNSGLLIHHYKKNNIWNTCTVDSISYNVLTNFVVVYDKDCIPSIFYFKLYNGFEELFVSIFDINTNTWSEPLQISNSKKNKIYLSVIRDSKNFYHILFSENNSNKYYCSYIHGYINENYFYTTDIWILSDTVACTFPNIIEADNKIYAHWVEYHNLYVRSSDDYGSTWGQIIIAKNSSIQPFVCCNYHSNYDTDNKINYFTMFMPENSLEILGLDL